MGFQRKFLENIPLFQHENTIRPDGAPLGALLVVLQVRKLKPRVVMHCSQVHTAVARPPQVQNQSGSRAAVDGGKNTAGEGRLASPPE